MKEIDTSGAGISMHSVEPALTVSSETPPSSTENSVSFSRFRPPYLIGIASAGMYLRRAISLLRFYIIVAIRYTIKIGRQRRQGLLEKSLCDLCWTSKDKFALGSLG